MQVFVDSWDHYNVITDKWSSGGTDCSIDLTGTKSRTGIGCLVINSAAFGPRRILPASYNQLIVGTAYYSDSVSQQDVIRFINATATTDQYIRVVVLADGSIRVLLGTDPFPVTLGQSVPGVYQFSAYNYIEAKVFIANSPNGSVEIRVNGAVVLSLAGITTIPSFGTNPPNVETIQLMGAGGIADLRHDDTYVVDWSTAPNDDYYGACRIYAQEPTDDGTIQWTPSIALAPNYTMVDEIPPNADTDYVSAATVGLIDQYSYPITGVPANSTIIGVQHVLDAKLAAAGSASIGSVASGFLGIASSPLTTGYKMHTFEWDENPGTGLPWTMAEFPQFFGPETTA